MQVSSLVPPRVSLELSSDCQAWWQAPSTLGPSFRPPECGLKVKVLFPKFLQYFLLKYKSSGTLHEAHFDRCTEVTEAVRNAVGTPHWTSRYESRDHFVSVKED